MSPALRVRIRLDRSGAELLSAVPVDVLVPGGDRLPPDRPAGLWVDVLDRDQKLIYSKVLDVVPDGRREVFDHDGPIRRVPEDRPRREYVFFVPVVDPGEQTLVIQRSDPASPTIEPATGLDKFSV